MRGELRTDRLNLCLFNVLDVQDLHALFSDPRTNTIGTGPYTAVEQTERWISNRQEAFEELGLAWYALRLHGSPHLVGNCGMLTGRTGASEPEIGYMVAASYRGRGYASEAAGAVLAECDAAGITTVWATIRPGNSASRCVVERHAFVNDRTEWDEKGALIYYVRRKAL